MSNYPCSEKILSIVRLACTWAGISLFDVIGAPHQNATDVPEKVLPQYDLVFAKGRTALEALAVGCSVIVWNGEGGCGPLVTAAEFDHLRRWNFGFRIASQPVTPAFLAEQIARILPLLPPPSVKKCGGRGGLHLAVDQIVWLYETVLAEHQSTPTNEAAAARATAVYWQSLLPLIKRTPKSNPTPTRRRIYEKLTRWLRGAEAHLLLGFTPVFMV